MIGMQHELDSDVCLVYSLQYGGPQFKSKLSVPLLKAANSWLLSYHRLSQTPQTIINTTFCQTQPSVMACVPTTHSHVQSILSLSSSSLPFFSPFPSCLCLCRGSTQPETGPLVKYLTIHRWDWKTTTAWDRTQIYDGSRHSAENRSQLENEQITQQSPEHKCTLKTNLRNYSWEVSLCRLCRWKVKPKHIMDMPYESVPHNFISVFHLSCLIYQRS